MGDEERKGCRTLEEQIYWNHFRFINFTRTLNPGFEQELVIPLKFSRNLKTKLPKSVFLKGPSGVTWNVGLLANEDALYFKNGWPEFISDHSLAENDLLVFRYNGDAQFEVLMFDGQSSCEREASYFVKKCDNSNDVNNANDNVINSNAGPECVLPENTNSTAKRTIKCSLGQNGNISSNGVGRDLSASGEDSDDPIMKDLCPQSSIFQDIISPETTASKKPKLEDATIESFRAKRTRRVKKAPINTRELVARRESDAIPTPLKVGGGYTDVYISNRRPVTEDEIRHALMLAEDASDENSFRVIMRPTHVYRRFYVSISKESMALMNLTSDTKEVILRMGGEEWQARFYTTLGSRCSRGLTGGWRWFAVDNNLEEFDVCVFTPGGYQNNRPVLDVQIFRVVEEITRYTPVLSSPRSNKKDLERFINSA